MASELTDEEMAALDRIIVGDDGVRPIMFPWIAKALTEIRARRAREKALVAWADESTRRAEAALCAVAPRSIREVELQMKVATIKAVLAILEAK